MSSEGNDVTRIDLGDDPDGDLAGYDGAGAGDGVVDAEILPAPNVAVALTYLDSTKNFARFREVVPSGASAAIGTLYLKLSAWSDLGEPQAIVVTVEPAL